MLINVLNAANQNANANSKIRRQNIYAKTTKTNKEVKNMEYRGLIEISQQDIPLRGKYTKIGLQAINDFQAKNIQQAKIDISYTNETELKSLYNALKSIVRRKKLPVRVSIYKDKDTNKKAIYLTKESSSF